MKLEAKIRPLQLDSYGTNLQEAVRVNKPLSFYELIIVTYIANGLFVLTDFVCLYSVWNIVQTESAWMVRLIALGCAVCLDVPMAITGLVMKRYSQGFVKKSTVCIIAAASIATFLITFAFSLWFRLETRELTFDIGGSGFMVNALSNTAEDHSGNKAVVVAALFNGVVPLCTSITSFVMTYFASNPLKEKQLKLKKERIAIESRLADITKILAEAECVQEYKAFLLAREEDLFHQFCSECRVVGEIRKQATGLAIVERLTDPDDITRVTESRKVQKECSGYSEEPFNEAVGTISNKEDVA